MLICCNSEWWFWIDLPRFYFITVPLNFVRDKFLHRDFAPLEPESRAELWETNFGRPNFGIHPREIHPPKFTFHQNLTQKSGKQIHIAPLQGHLAETLCFSLRNSWRFQVCNSGSRAKPGSVPQSWLVILALWLNSSLRAWAHRGWLLEYFPEGPTIKKIKSHSKFSIPIKIFNLARKFQSQRLELPTKIGPRCVARSKISFSLEIFNLARNLIFFWSLGPLGSCLAIRGDRQNLEVCLSYSKRASEPTSRKRCDFENVETLRFEIPPPRNRGDFLFQKV